MIDVESVQTSCGWGVPRMALEKERQTLVKYHAQQDADGISRQDGDADDEHRRAARSSADGAARKADLVSLAEVGRFDRNLANIIAGRLEAEGIPAVVFDGGSSIADGSYLLIPVRVMVDADDLAKAQAIVAAAA